MNYPDKALVIDSLIEAARAAAYRENLDHPEDIAAHMSTAIDASAPAIMHFFAQQGKVVDRGRQA